jgi:hypothetical protein
VAKGTVSVVFEGTQGGTPKKVDLRELAEPPVTELAFKFHHFGRVGGIFNLPKVFSPTAFVSQCNRKASAGNR